MTSMTQHFFSDRSPDVGAQDELLVDGRGRVIAATEGHNSLTKSNEACPPSVKPSITYRSEIHQPMTSQADAFVNNLFVVLNHLGRWVIPIPFLFLSFQHS